jgi:hypothetical protein
VAFTDRLHQLRRRGNPGVVALWIDALPKDEALTTLAQIHESWAVLALARLHAQSGEVEAAQAHLCALGPLPPGLCLVKDRIEAELAQWREQRAPPVEEPPPTPSVGEAKQRLARWLSRVEGLAARQRSGE